MTAPVDVTDHSRSSARPMPHPDIETAFVAPQAILYDERNGAVFELSPSASAVWLLIDGHAAVADVTSDLAEILGRSPGEVESDVHAAIADFQERGLLALGDDDLDTAETTNRDHEAVAVDRLYAVRPPPGCGCGSSGPRWSGQVNLRIGNALFGVAYQDETVAAKIRAAFAPMLDLGDVESRPPVISRVFGLRTARVGLRRRQIGLVYFGSTLRHRAADLDAALQTLSRIVTDVDQAPDDALVAVDVRVLVKADQAVLVEAPPNLDVDERPLAKRGIESVPCWRAIIDPVDESVVVNDRRVPIVGIVVAGALVNTPLHQQLTTLWWHATGDRSAWAWMLDHWADRITPAPDDPVASIKALLR